MNSLWVNTSDTLYPAFSGHIDVDIAIVGGGLSGAGALYALRDSHASVALLEGRTIASGASGRNAGFLLAGSAIPYGEACERYGVAAAREVWDLTVRNNRLIARLVQEHVLDCDFMRRGSMSLAIDIGEMAALRDTSCRLAEAGISVSLLSAEDLPAPFDTMYVGGLYYPGNAEIDPAAFVRGMVRTSAASAQVFEQSPVLELQAGSPHRLVTAHGCVRARTVILATNAYTDTLLPGVNISATRGQVLATAPLPGLVVPFPMYANFGYQYWRQTPSGRLVVGGWRDLDTEAEVGTEEVVHTSIQERLVEFCAIVAGNRTFKVTDRWSGAMGFTPDLLPLVGAVPDLEDVFIAAGYSGHGVSMAFSCGSMVAERATGSMPAIPTVFSPGRFV